MKHNALKSFGFFLSLGVVPVLVGGFLGIVNAEDMHKTNSNTKKGGGLNVKQNITKPPEKIHSSLKAITQQATRTSDALVNGNSIEIKKQRKRLEQVMILQAKKPQLKSKMPLSKKRITVVMKKNTVIHRNIKVPNTPIKNSPSVAKIAQQAEKTADAIANRNPIAVKQHKKRLRLMMVQRMQIKQPKQKILSKKNTIRKYNDYSSSLEAIVLMAENLADAHADGNVNVIAKQRHNLIQVMQQNSKY
jgi:hypothetical protein